VRVYRNDIVGKMKYRGDLITLLYSQHAKKRLWERSGELIVAPTILRVTDTNIYSGEWNGKKLTEACVRIEYKKSQWMFLVIILSSGLVKSLWINDKKRVIRKEVGNLEGNLEVSSPQIRSKWYSYIRRIKEFLHGSFN